MPANRDRSAADGHVTSVLRALALLEAFDRERPSSSLGELAAATGLSKATAHRLLATLEHAGWVAREGVGAYRLTTRAFEVGAGASATRDVRSAARSLMAELVDRFDDTVFLTVLDGERVLCLDRADGDQPVKILALDVGRSLPLTVGGAPVAILAHHPELVAAATRAGDVDSAVLQRRLADVRAAGYAVSREDVTPGVCAVGAPFFDAQGEAIGALSIAGLVNRFGGDREAVLADGVVAAAARLSERLGRR